MGVVGFETENDYFNCSIHATALATFAETVGELGLLSSLQDDKDEIELVSLELDVTYTLFLSATIVLNSLFFLLVQKEGSRLINSFHRLYLTRNR